MREWPLILAMLAATLCTSLPTRAQTGPTILDEAFQAAQWGFLSSAGSALFQTSQRLATGDGALAQRLQARQVLADRIETAEASLARLGTDTATDDRTEFTRIAGDISQLKRELEALDADITRDFPDFARMARPMPLSVEDVQSHLEPDEGLLFVFTGNRQTHVWLVTHEHAIWHRLDLGADELGETVTNIRSSLRAASTLRAAEALDEDFAAENIPAFDRVSAWLLYSELLYPLEPYMTGLNHVYTVSDGPLSGLPLGLLITDRVITGEDGDAQALRDTGWLFQRHALTTLPSVESLALVTTPRPAPKGDTLAFLGFGDPAFSGGLENPSGGQFFRSGSADLDSIRALAPLPNTRREIRRLEQVIGPEASSIHLGADASEATVRTAPTDRARVIAFATHGLLSGELQGLAEPALVLTPPETAQPGNDGVLTSSEIAAMTFSADWVVLSACNTAGSDGRPDAEGLSGLARAFLFAGARSLLVSHWPVRDDAAARLTTETFSALANGSVRRKAKALQAAMQSVLNDESDPTLAHPAAWAPFVIVGHGGS